MNSLKVVSVSLVFFATLVGCGSDVFTSDGDAGDAGDPTQDAAPDSDPQDVAPTNDSGSQDSGADSAGDTGVTNDAGTDGGDNLDSGVNDAGSDAGDIDSGPDAAICSCPTNGASSCNLCLGAHSCSDMCSASCFGFCATFCGCTLEDGGSDSGLIPFCNGFVCN